RGLGRESRAARAVPLSQKRREISRLVLLSDKSHLARWKGRNRAMTTPVLRQSSKRLLAQLIEEPDLDEQLAGLRGVEWKALVSAVGLEDSGELLALASTDQLLEVFDEELW